MPIISMQCFRMETIKEETETSEEMTIEEHPIKVEQTEPINMVMGEGLPNTVEQKRLQSEKEETHKQEEELMENMPLGDMELDNDEDLPIINAIMCGEELDNNIKIEIMDDNKNVLKKVVEGELEHTISGEFFVQAKLPEVFGNDRYEVTIHLERAALELKANKINFVCLKHSELQNQAAEQVLESPNTCGTWTWVDGNHGLRWMNMLPGDYRLKLKSRCLSTCVLSTEKLPEKKREMGRDLHLCVEVKRDGLVAARKRMMLRFKSVIHQYDRRRTSKLKIKGGGSELQMARRRATSDRAAADAVMSFIHSLDINRDKLNITKVLKRCLLIQKTHDEFDSGSEILDQIDNYLTTTESDTD